jgi:hypothetical protein
MPLDLFTCECRQRAPVSGLVAETSCTGDCSAQWLTADRVLDEMRRNIDAWDGYN